ncbi:MAG TPA: quinone-dependent dihydroorotate dehydrogenase [Anaeromyxobacteraceae bacterium]|nr:quinone-dependent dihydroorotate dehydrogenase [Anaeromyxobacteraceae bacterium]
MFWRALRWLLFRFDPEYVHGLAVVALRALGWRPLARALRPHARSHLAVDALGLHFEHPLGLAAGFDKGEVIVAGLFALGFSHVEIGTLTPRPQPGNPRPRLFRLPEHQALLNRMGFNNAGAQACARRLAALSPADRPGLLGVNIGKNKLTPNDRAEEDYLACIEELHPFADYLVVNISSPNTPGLRELQARGALERLLGACAERIRALQVPKPLLVKLAPDLGPDELDEAVDVALSVGIAGIVATNTTVQRPGGVSAHPRAAEAGGLSGLPLEPLALGALRRIYARVGDRVPIIGVGGILNARDAYARVRSGATLVQAYTGYIYGGPGFVRGVLTGLEKLLEADGFSRLSDAIGADVRRSRPV